MNEIELSHQTPPKNVYSRIEPDLCMFRLEQLEQALKELEEL